MNASAQVVRFVPYTQVTRRAVLPLPQVAVAPARRALRRPRSRPGTCHAARAGAAARAAGGGQGGTQQQRRQRRGGHQRRACQRGVRDYCLAAACRPRGVRLRPLGVGHALHCYRQLLTAFAMDVCGGCARRLHFRWLLRAAWLLFRWLERVWVGCGIHVLLVSCEPFAVHAISIGKRSFGHILMRSAMCGSRV